MHWLGIDMGGSATRWVLRDDAGTITARGQTAGASAGLFTPAATTAFEAALVPIARAAPQARGVVMGMTGSGLIPDATIRAAAEKALRIPAKQMTLLNDMVLAWHTAYPQGLGHLILAGTGSVGMSIDALGAVTLVGGRGSTIDDAGSGTWITLQAVQRLWRIIDLHGAPKGAETLARHLFTAFGGSDWEQTRRAIYGRDRGQIGVLATCVAKAATEGDAVAQAILREAGGELARLVTALTRRCGAAPVAAIGGALGLHPMITEALEAALPGQRLTYPTLDPAAHGALIARQQFSARTA